MNEPSSRYRRTACAVALSLLVSQGITTLAYADNDQTAVSIPNPSNNVTAIMNQAASYASQQRLAVMNSLYQAPIKQKLQDMTCLDKIALIQFVGLSSISFSSVINTIIQQALMALMKAVCSVVDQAWNSAMGTLTSMTTINMGNAGSLSLVQANGNTVDIGPVYNSGSNPYLAGIGNQINSNNGGNGATSSSGYAGFGSTVSNGLNSAWEATKNLFK